MQTETVNSLNVADSNVLALQIARILLEKKGIDVKVYDVREKSSVTDFYVNVTARSNTHVSSLSNDISYEIELLGREPLHTEGRSGQSWILVDYADVIVNIFDRQSRDFYALDRHLPVDSLVDLTEVIAEVDKKFGNNSN